MGIDEKPPRDRGGGRLKSYITVEPARTGINLDQNAPRASSIVDRVCSVPCKYICVVVLESRQCSVGALRVYGSAGMAEYIV